MYTQFYGLREKPFNVTADPNFMFFSRHHKEALAHLFYGIKERKGFLEITGEVGTGKTTLCRVLLNSLDEKTKTAFILNPNLSEVQLLRAMAVDLGIKTEAKNKNHLISTLNTFLIEQLSSGFNVVVIIDEAQNLKPTLLEQVRMLSNLETEKDKLFQIVLVGQPELRDKLNSPHLRQLRQRISVQYHILPLELDEIGQYINHRLNVAGSDGSIIFTDKAIDHIYRYSEGVPRLINIVCDRALLAGYVLEKKKISHDLIIKCVRELEWGKRLDKNEEEVDYIMNFQ
jgi:general secretion pathway protein A